MNIVLTTSSEPAILLVDPPMGTYAYSCTNPPQKVDISKREPYQGGYFDFQSWQLREGIPGSGGLAAGPGRESLLDDLILYYTNRSFIAPGMLDLKVLSELPKKIAVGYWLNGVEYLKKQVSVFQNKLEISNYSHNIRSRGPWIPKQEYGSLFLIEENLSLLNGWQRISSQMCDWMDENFGALGLEGVNGGLITQSLERKNDEDWRYILNTLEKLCTRTWDLNPSALGQLALAESQAAVRLTVIGSGFAVLSLSSTILSMSNNYAPGKERFWVFFVLAACLSLFLFTCMNTVHPFIEKLKHRTLKR